MRQGCHRALAVGAALGSCVAARAGAQQRDSAQGDSAPVACGCVVTRAREGRVRPELSFTAAPPAAPLLTRRDLVAAGALAVATVALLPFDARIAEEFRDPAPQHARLLRGGARTFNVLGDPGTVIVGVAAFGVGKVSGSRGLADLGLHTSEAIVLSGAATGLIKGVAGRQRPFLARNDADVFAAGRGFSSGDRASFPSGHATAAFAAAAAITEETRYWRPGAPWVVGPLLYGGAGMVALARMYDDKHWASDVVLGAGIGTISGLAVVRYNHARPRNRVDRWLGVAATPSLIPSAGGVSVAWNLAAP
ncbi:MAG: phosphatase PAP2 family protein [Gemmatimonadaceae bacterium]